MATINVTDASFEEEVLKSDKPVVLDFGHLGVDLVSKSVPLLKRYQMKWLIKSPLLKLILMKTLIHPHSLVLEDPNYVSF